MKILNILFYNKDIYIYIYIITYYFKRLTVMKVIAEQFEFKEHLSILDRYFLLCDNIYSNTNAEQMYVIKESLLYHYVKGIVELGKFSLSALFLLTI